MRATVRKWGNSAAVRLPAAVMQAARLELDAAVDVREEDGRVVIGPVREAEIVLTNLLAGITDNNMHGEIGTGPAWGRRGSVSVSYIPEAGDVVWLRFTLQTGHEQAGHRPAVVVSPASYNRISLMLCCPMTTRIKGYPFEVRIEGELPSVVLTDQVKSLDWRVRGARRKGVVTPAELAAVRAKAGALIIG